MDTFTATTIRSLLIATALSLTTVASLAQTSPTGLASATQNNYTNGEIKKIDASAKRVTIKHEAIKHLDMPGMTMVFQTNDAKLLDGLVTSDRVSFLVESRAGALVVTDLRRIQP
jgi:Cu(I)/Ag(I) efflux system periplasmic protein CusF